MNKYLVRIRNYYSLFDYTGYQAFSKIVHADHIDEATSMAIELYIKQYKDLMPGDISTCVIGKEK